jgi:hypothetical protein
MARCSPPSPLLFGKGCKEDFSETKKKKHRRLIVEIGIGMKKRKNG